MTSKLINQVNAFRVQSKFRACLRSALGLKEWAIGENREVHFDSKKNCICLGRNAALAQDKV